MIDGPELESTQYVTGFEVFPGERSMVKLPSQFIELFKRSRPLDEDTGEALARWAAGDTGAASEVDMASVLAELGRAATLAALEATAKARSRMSWTPAQRAAIKQAIDLRQAQIRHAKPEIDPETGEEIPADLPR